MGSEDLFHKRRPKKLKDLKRKKPTHKPRKKILLVCEGLKTEPNYFDGLISHHKLSTADIKIADHRSSDPMSIFNIAKKLYIQSVNEGNQFDEVYCIIDRDSHANFDAALDAIKGYDKGLGFF
ncbi:RloB family protein [Vreelandella aquamarina]|uniref:RloB family protein n=1 Tax=Vreelandella aquamarina TaxID=77097 RepID=UPI00384C15FC